MVTYEIIRNVKQFGWKPFEDKIWQRNYYEHIIRNSVRANCTCLACGGIRPYESIRNNPAQWQEDEYYK